MCKQGDVAIDETVDVHMNTPMILWNKKFMHIQTNGFNDNNNGARLLCRQLGYDNGSVIEGVPSQLIEGSTSTWEILMIGTCSNEDKSLSDCTGGNNTYEHYSIIDMYTSMEHFKKITIVKVACKGKNNTLGSSCKGKNNILEFSYY